MADNFPQTPGSGRNVATDQVTYSGDTADLQLMRVAFVTGSEGSKTVVEFSLIDVAISANLPVWSTGGRASTAIPSAISGDGDAQWLWLDRNGATVVNGRDAHDAAIDSLTNPQLIGGRSSAAAPSDVSGDGDAVRAWFLRNGSQVTALSFNGTLIGGAEDGAAGSNAGGVGALGRRNDANASRAGSDGDYAFLSIDAGGNANTRPRPDVVRVQVTSGGLTTASTAYTAGDQVGTQFTFAGCARASGGGGYITGVVIHDETDVVGPLDLFVFDSSVTPASDNAANAWSDSDMQKLVDIIPLAVVDSGNNRVCNSGPIRVPYVCSGGTSLYGCIVTRSGHTFFGATTSIKVVIYVEPS